MADPTLEELQTQIDELKSLITTEYEPPSGSEYSYPVVNQPMNDEMWQYVTLGLGDGILDDGGGPYVLVGRENAGNSLRISVSNKTGTAQAVLRGFYHRMTADKTFTVPGVSSTTLYHFCLTYDPSGHSRSEGPITLQMYAGTPPTTLGRNHIILYTLERKPNQLLTDAAVRRMRPRVAPAVYVWAEDHKPDPESVLWGTLCVVGATGNIYRSTNEVEGGSGEDAEARAWVSLTSPPWKTLSLSGNRAEAGHGFPVAYQRVGDTVRLRGHIARTDGNNFTTPSGGWQLTTLPASVTPSRGHVGVGVCSGQNPPRFARIEVRTDGQVWAWVDSTTSWIGIDGIEFDIS